MENLGVIGLFILVISVATVSHNEITDRYNPLVKEDWLYVKVKTKGEYIETYQEVQPNEIPKEIEEKLDK